MINSVAMAGMPNKSGVGITPPPTGNRTLIFPHARFRIIQRWPSGNTADAAFANAHFSDILGGSLTTHVDAISVQRYALLLQCESNNSVDYTTGAWNPPSDDSQHAVAWVNFAKAYAIANGQDVEEYWLHAGVGKHTNVAGIMGITSAGVVSFNFPNGGGFTSSFPYTPGMTVSVSGLTVGNGNYIVSSITRSGITLAGWSAGALGPLTQGASKLGTVYTLGDGTLSLANRLQNWGWSSWTLISNFDNTNVQGMHAARFAQALVVGGQPNVNGVMIDSMSSGDFGNMAVANSVEYAVSGTTQVTLDAEATLTAIRAYPGAAKFLRANTAGYLPASNAQVATAAGGIHDETALGIFPYSSTDQYYSVRNLVNAGVYVEYSNGGTWTISGSVGTQQGIPGNMTLGNYVTKTGRYQMALYCNYLLVVDATKSNPDGTTYKYAIMCVTNGWVVGQTPISAMWTPGFEYNIGQPMATATLSGTLVDPAGFNIRTFTRPFSLDGGTTMSAFVVFVGNTGSSGTIGTNYGENSLMTVTVPAAPAGKVWKMLNADGTLGVSFTTSVNVRRAEGLILVAA